MNGFFSPASQAVSNQPRIVMTGRTEVLIEQHKGLFSYETRCIRVRTKEGLIMVKGEEMVIAFFGVQDLLIQGHISAIEMDGKPE